MIKLPLIRKTVLALSSLVVVIASTGVNASDIELPSQQGVAQSSPEEPAKLSNLKLSDELVKSKFLSDSDLLRFLRGTYSEACVRGMLNEATKMVKENLKSEYTSEESKSAGQLLEMNRIWKLTSLEMEALFGNGYVHSAHYCDCLIKELSSNDLVDPKKSIEIIDELPLSTQGTCERIAAEKTERYVSRYGNAGGASVLLK